MRLQNPNKMRCDSIILYRCPKHTSVIFIQNQKLTVFLYQYIVMMLDSNYTYLVVISVNIKFITTTHFFVNINVPTLVYV